MDKFIATVVGAVKFEDGVVVNVIAVVFLSKVFVVKEAIDVFDLSDVVVDEVAVV